MADDNLIHGDLSRAVISAFFEVYNTMGYGFLEHIYCVAMEGELKSRGLAAGREVAVEVRYKGNRVGFQRLDMVVDDKIIVEIKSSAVLSPTAKRQLHNYLRATDLEVGLLLHFGPSPKFYRQVVTRPN
ncbi:MAG TPA: GxxExxY protein, partial [Gemmatimonadaceae bacterium]|nr:GxxExxY protein [Gemmatimonadaceae bacterium]